MVKSMKLDANNIHSLLIQLTQKQSLTLNLRANDIRYHKIISKCYLFDLEESSRPSSSMESSS